jgi:hypothetical protein
VSSLLLEDRSMHELTTVFIFESSDGLTLGLTTMEGGSNLPRLPAEAVWEYRVSVPMTIAGLSQHVRMPEVALSNLIMRGYHLTRLTADVIKFPGRQASGS